MVTSNYHTRRVRYIFRRIFPAQEDVLIIAARDYDYDPDHWWESRQGRKLFFLESVSYITAVWELWEDEEAARQAAPPPENPTPEPTPNPATP